MTEKEAKKSRVTRFEEKVDSALGAAVRQKKESIRKSMVRPLRTELARTGYIVGCIILDLVVLPSLFVLFIDRIFVIPFMIVTVPILAYYQYKLHGKWFPLPDDKPTQTG